MLEHLQDLERQLERMRSGWDRSNSPIVSAQDIAEVVSMWTGVPVMQIAQEESMRLLQMEEELRRSIIGQEEAIQSISKAVRRARAGLKDPRRPIGSLIFLGPTGVGNTELTHPSAAGTSRIPARYFAVGQVGRDQVADYAARKGMSLVEAERWLAPSLGYDPAASAG